MFPSTLGQIARYFDVDVKGAVSFASKDIDRWPFRHPQSLDSRFRGNDEIYPLDYTKYLFLN